MPHHCRYTYNVHKEMEERRKNPTEAQRRITEMLMEKRANTLGGRAEYSDKPR